MFFTFMKSPVGDLLLAGSEQSLSLIGFPEGKGHVAPKPEWRESKAAFKETVSQLNEYFAGERRVFDLNLAPSGTPFQREVLDALLTIPFGETRTYLDIATIIKRPKAVRAVGAANGRNPLPIVIPCHRVIGADGSLTGFGGGLPTKSWLLNHEGVIPGEQASLF